MIKASLIVIFILTTMAQTSLGKENDIKFDEMKMKIGAKIVTVEIADTEEKSQRGLMFRKKLSDSKGMLFVFGEEQPRTFWMKNTFIRLDIGYFNKDRKLIDIQEMEPVKSEMETPKVYPSRGPAQFVLEVNAGWFKKNKIEVGEVFTLLPAEKSGNPKK